MLIKKLVVIGVGLIGGSFALALKRAGVVGEVVGIGRDDESLDAAIKLGVIDRVATTYADALLDADLVLIATPVRQIPTVFASLVPHLNANTIVTDTGSTKQDIIAAARILFGSKINQFVPAHPIAGRELSGVAAAEVDLYLDRNVVIVPLAENAPASIALIESAWKSCGAVLQRLDATEHDAVFAAVSHLPHLLSFALVDDIGQRPNAKTLFTYAAGGFRDFTRLAGASPEMWRDISLNNREAILTELEHCQASLAALHTLLTSSNGAALEALMAHSRDARTRWLAGDLDSFASTNRNEK